MASESQRDLALRPSSKDTAKGLEERRPSGFHFLTPVWGASYTRLYVETVIPAQLAEGNLPALKGRPGCRYVIYTTPQDAETIRDSRIFEQLSACVPVSFEWLDGGVEVVHDMMSACFRRGIDTANHVDAAVIFLTPDIVFAAGSFATLISRSDSGNDVVFIPAIRTFKQGVVHSLQRYRTDGVEIDVRPRELMRIALDNLHPLADSSWWNQGETDLLPANLYWPIADEGLLGRCFHLHPILVYPQNKHARFFGTVDDDFVSVACPDNSNDYVVTDSDEFLGIELSDPAHFFSTGFRKGSVADTVTWAEQFTDARHRTLFNCSVKMHAGIKHKAAWDRAAAEAELVAEKVKLGLQTPTHDLFRRGDPTIIRRLLRIAKNKRLNLENQVDNVDATRNLVSLVERRLNVFKRWPVWLLNLYEGLLATVIRRRNRYLGTFDQPRFFTLNFLTQHLLRLDALKLTGAAPEALLICNEPEHSFLRALLRKTNTIISTGNYLKSAHGYDFILAKTGESVPPRSSDLVLIEIRRSEELRGVIEMAHRALRPGGRVLVLTDRIGLRKGLTTVRPLSLEGMQQLLQPYFSIEKYVQQGASGSAAFYEFSHWLKARSRRRPISSRLIELSLLWVPFYIVIGLVGFLAVPVIDRFDRKRSTYVSSLALAVKVGEENSRVRTDGREEKTI